MKFTQKDFEKNLEGYYITDCVVRRKTMLYFVLEEDFGEKTHQEMGRTQRTRVVSCFASENPDQVWSHSEITGLQTLRAGVSYHPKEQFVGVSLNDHVFVIGSGDGGGEQDLKGSNSRELKAAKAPPEAYLLRGGISRLKTIDGYVYGCGLGRTVITRQGKNDWFYHEQLPKDKHFLDPTGFYDIDGFSGKDIYAAGGHGDVWHFDGERWKQLAFPSNMTLEALCCAGDGYVYIGAEQGTVFKGRGDQWEMIYRGNMALPYRDMVWYEGQVWCASDYGIWTITNGKLEEADVPASVAGCSGHLSVGDGVLLLAGIYGAALYDGKTWQSIISYGDLGA